MLTVTRGGELSGFIHSSGQTVVSFSHIEGITLGPGEEFDKVAGGASGMGVDRIGEVGDRTSE